MDTLKRCAWCTQDPLYQHYHDTEWGVPLYDDQQLFEFLNLEGMQAGLSWLTILKKREHYRKVFAHFDPVKIARFNEKKIEALLLDPGIIRNRLKVNAIVQNSKAFLSLQKKGINFSTYLWQFTDGEIITNNWKKHTDVPCSTAESKAMSKALKKEGFKFVGETICYAFMQATGMVNDHLVSCYRHGEV